MAGKFASFLRNSDHRIYNHEVISKITFFPVIFFELFSQSEIFLGTFHLVWTFSHFAFTKATSRLREKLTQSFKLNQTVPYIRLAQLLLFHKWTPIS